MTQTPEAHSRRVRRLLRCYPPQWRARYGDEFTELLLAELTERPWSWRLTADVARGGAAARLASATWPAVPWSRPSRSGRVW